MSTCARAEILFFGGHAPGPSGSWAFLHAANYPGAYQVWDDFDIIGSPVVVTALFGDHTVEGALPEPAIAEIEIRSGVSTLIYKSGIIVPRVELIGTTRFHTPSHAIKFLTGQQITGGVDAGIAGPFPMPTVTTRAWSVDNGDPNYEGAPPNIFKSYTHTNTLGQLNAHNWGDIAASTFSFYTADGMAAGRPMQVKCDLTLALPPISRFNGGLPEFTAKSKIVEAVKPPIHLGLSS